MSAVLGTSAKVYFTLYLFIGTSLISFTLSNANPRVKNKRENVKHSYGTYYMPDIITRASHLSTH